MNHPREDCILLLSIAMDEQARATILDLPPTTNSKREENKEKTMTKRKIVCPPTTTATGFIQNRLVMSEPLIKKLKGFFTLNESAFHSRNPDVLRRLHTGGFWFLVFGFCLRCQLSFI